MADETNTSGEAEAFVGIADDTHQTQDAQAAALAGFVNADGEAASTSPFGSPFTSPFRSPFQDITT